VLHLSQGVLCGSPPEAGASGLRSAPRRAPRTAGTAGGETAWSGRYNEKKRARHATPLQAVAIGSWAGEARWVEAFLAVRRGRCRAEARYRERRRGEETQPVRLCYQTDRLRSAPRRAARAPSVPGGSLRKSPRGGSLGAQERAAAGAPHGAYSGRRGRVKRPLQ